MLVHQMIEMPNIKAGWFSNPGQSFFYDFSGEIFTLRDIKHGILRGNKKPTNGYTRVFSNSDSRNILQGFNDPRILLVCKDPPCLVKGLVDFCDQVETKLDELSADFCNREVCINIPVEEFVLSSMFKEYMADFGGTEAEIVRWIMNFYRKCNLSYEQVMKLIGDQALFLTYKEFN